MYCKKCGFNISTEQEKCPFCGTPTKEDIVEKVDIEIEKNEKVEENINKTPAYDDYVPYGQTIKEADNLKNSLGYFNINTKWWVHVLFACIGYVGMDILYSIIGRAMLRKYINQGYDFSCITDETLACEVGVEQAYTKVSMIAQLSAELLIVASIALILFKSFKLFFKGLAEKKTFKWFGIMFGIMYGANYVYSFILEILEISSSNANQDSVTDLIINHPLLGFVFVVVAAPLFEEIIFRFGVFRAFTFNSKKSTEIIGIAVTTFIFAFIHMVASIEVGTFVEDLPTFPIYLIGAFCLTFMYYKSKHIATSMIGHMCWNLLSFISIMVLSNANEPVSEVIRLIFSIF